MLKIIFLLACSQVALSFEEHSTPFLPLRKVPDTLLNFMESTYKTGRMKSTADAGKPLLLTPYIEENNIEAGRTAAKVDPDILLPDMDSYAGYLTVNKEYNSNIWFWYFPVQDLPIEDTPWILWLQGGPGASSLFGLFTEIGPFVVTKDITLEEMKYSWGRNHSLLFIDNPVGTGFSFTDDDRGYSTNQDQIAENLYNAFQQFLTLFPELRKAPLTIAGESYAGKHIPSLGIQILRNRENDPPINLHGLAIGNGLIDPLTLHRYSYFVREVGLVDDKVADHMLKLEKTIIGFIKNKELLTAYAYHNELLDVILSESRVENLYNYLKDDLDLEGPFVEYIQSNKVRKALHVGNTSFASVGIVYRKLLADLMNSTKGCLEELLENYKVMLYNGHLDIIISYHPSVNTYNSLSFTGAEEYKKSERSAWYHDNVLSGYYKTGGNLTDVMVRGAGHMVPSDKPAAALALISAFIRGVSLEEDTGYLVGGIEKSELRRRSLELSYD